MGKTEFAEYLRKEGYEVVIEEGMVIVIDQDKRTFAKMIKLANAAGYSMSMGWRKEVGA